LDDWLSEEYVDEGKERGYAPDPIGQQWRD
jgi:hypothetical protein